MQRLLILLVCLGLPLAGFGQTTTVYRHVDEQGNVSYSTEPREGAEEVVIRESNVSQAREPLPPMQEQADEPDPGPPYSRFVIASPAEDETIWNTGTRDLTVRIELDPPLRSHHSIHVEAAEREARGSRTRFELEDINRGTHQVTARILDSAGNVVQTAEGHQFHVRQHSVATPP